MRRAGFLLIAIASWAVFSGTAGAQNQVICDGLVATVVGTPGDDFLLGTDGPDIISGLQGDDVIFGADGDDVICGGIGNDTIFGGQGFDVIFGAQGDDVIYAAAFESVYAPGLLTDTAGSRIFAGAGNDVVIGSDRWDRMQGGPGDDSLFGFAGRDWMRGGPGADVVAGHDGIDDLHGGGGADTIYATRNDANVRGGAGQDLCPSIPGTSFRGCQVFFDADPSDSTLPNSSVPAALAGGEEDTYVYLGFVNGEQSFIGTTTDLAEADFDPRFSSNIVPLNDLPLTNGQAKSVQAAILDQNFTFSGNNPISSAAAHHTAAVAWGNAWLEVNQFEFVPQGEGIMEFDGM